MSDIANIRSAVAKFFRVPEDSVTEDFVFHKERLQGSVARSTLHAAILRIAKADLATAFTANSFGELLGEAGPVTGQAQQSASGIRIEDGYFGIGNDIEWIGSIPEIADPWDDHFFAGNFTPNEIAYCLQRADPRVSFLGLWTAKEAVIKALPAGTILLPSGIEILHEIGGRPVARIQASRIPGDATRVHIDVSISHAGEYASSVATIRRPPACADDEANVRSSRDGMASASFKPGPSSAKAAMILAVGSLLIALISLLFR